MVDWRELRRGVRETRRFLLAHHRAEDRYRCYAPQIGGHRRYICARCSGIYPGIVIGLTVHLLEILQLTPFVLVVLLPLPALIDWFLTTVTNRRGSNFIRTATGMMLGYGYGLGIGYVFHGHVASTFLVGVMYAVLAGVLLYLSK